MPDREVTLAPAPWFVRQMRLALWAGPVLALLGVGAFAVMFPQDFGPLLGSRPGAQLIATVVALLATLVLSVALAWRFTTGRSLVITARELRVESGGKVVAAAPLADVLVSPVSMLVGPTALVYRQALAPDRPGKWIYDEAQLRQYLFARLRPEQSVTMNQLQRAVLKRLPLRQKLIWGLLVLAAMGFVLWPVAVGK